MEPDDCKRLLALCIHDQMNAAEDQAGRLAVGRELLRLLAAAHAWVRELLERMDRAEPMPSLREHLQAVEDRITPAERGDAPEIVRNQDAP
jgi:hypothetical protein